MKVTGVYTIFVEVDVPENEVARIRERSNELVRGGLCNALISDNCERLNELFSDLDTEGEIIECYAEDENGKTIQLYGGN